MILVTGYNNHYDVIEYLYSRNSRILVGERLLIRQEYKKKKKEEMMGCSMANEEFPLSFLTQ